MIKTANLFGDVGISEDVIVKISAVLVLSCYGVMALSQKGKGRRILISKETGHTRGIKVTEQKDGVTIDVYIVAAYGVNMDSISANIRDSIISNVQKQTGIKVNSVNVLIRELGSTD